MNNAMNDPHFSEIWPLVEHWFDSKESAWRWYTEEQIIGFGRKTPKELVDEQGSQGVHEIEKFIKSKNLGGFE